jgi:hypothetical protein
MKAKHTPGPWEVREGAYIFAPDGSYVAKTTGNIKDYQENAKTEEANARLIAAAPDLLAALEETIKLLTIAGELIITLEGLWRGQPYCDCADCRILRRKLGEFHNEITRVNEITKVFDELKEMVS